MSQNSNTEFCQNCDEEFSHENQRYCSACGQFRQDKLTFSSLLQNAISSYFALDSKIIRTMVPFVAEPGEIAKNYISGKRKQYLSPFQVYVFFSFLMFFVGSKLYFNDWDKQLNKELSNPTMFEQMEKENAEMRNEAGASIRMGNDDEAVYLSIYKIDSLINQGLSNEQIIADIGLDVPDNPVIKSLTQAGFNVLRTKGKGTVLLIISQLSLVLIFSLLMASLFLLLLYRHQHFSYAEHLVFSAYQYALSFFLITLFFIVNKFLPEFNFWIYTGLILILFTQFLSLKRVYGQSWKKTLLKQFLLNFVSLIFILPWSIILLGALSVAQLGQ